MKIAVFRRIYGLSISIRQFCAKQPTFLLSEALGTTKSEPNIPESLLISTLGDYLPHRGNLLVEKLKASRRTGLDVDDMESLREKCYADLRNFIVFLRCVDEAEIPINSIFPLKVLRRIIANFVAKKDDLLNNPELTSRFFYFLRSMTPEASAEMKDLIERHLKVFFPFAKDKFVLFTLCCSREMPAKILVNSLKQQSLNPDDLKIIKFCFERLSRKLTLQDSSDLTKNWGKAYEVLDLKDPNFFDVAEIFMILASQLEKKEPKLSGDIVTRTKQALFNLIENQERKTLVKISEMVKTFPSLRIPQLISPLKQHCLAMPDTSDLKQTVASLELLAITIEVVRLTEGLNLKLYQKLVRFCEFYCNQMKYPIAETTLIYALTDFLYAKNYDQVGRQNPKIEYLKLDVAVLTLLDQFLHIFIKERPYFVKHILKLASSTIAIEKAATSESDKEISESVLRTLAHHLTLKLPEWTYDQRFVFLLETFLRWSKSKEDGRRKWVKMIEISLEKRPKEEKLRLKEQYVKQLISEKLTKDREAIKKTPRNRNPYLEPYEDE